MSKLTVRTPSGRARLHEDQVRLLQDLLDPAQEVGGRLAVDDPVVEGQAQPHRRPDHDLATARDRLLDDLADAEDRALGRVDDRCEDVDARPAEVGDREGATGRVGDLQPALLCPLAELLRLTSYLEQRAAVGVPYHRY